MLDKLKQMTPTHGIVVLIIIGCFIYFLMRTVDSALVALVSWALHMNSAQNKDAVIGDIAKNGGADAPTP